MTKIIAALGDSITQGYFDSTGAGWFGRLAAKISENQTCGFHNISASGDRVCDAWHRFCSQCITMDIDTLIIAVGVNDIVRRGADAPMDLSPGLRAEYWQWLLDSAKKNIANVVLLDILPIREDFDDGTAEVNRNIDIKDYNEQLAKMCQDRGIPFIRRYHKWENVNLSDFYFDWGHPNAKGHEKIAIEVYEELKKLGILN